MAKNIPTLPPQAYREKITAFANKFTAAERGAIWQHIQNESNDLTIYLKTASLSGGAFETDPTVIEALNKAVTANLVTSLRKDTILNAEI